MKTRNSKTTIRKKLRDRKVIKVVSDKKDLQQRTSPLKRKRDTKPDAGAAKLTNLLNSLQNDFVPIDNTAENTVILDLKQFEEAKFTFSEEKEVEEDSPDTWLVKVASQLGAATSYPRPKNRTQTIPQNNEASSPSGPLTGLEHIIPPGFCSNDLKTDVDSICSTISYSSGTGGVTFVSNVSVDSSSKTPPASVTIPHSNHKSFTSGINSSTIKFSEIDKELRKECIVIHKNDSKKRVGKVSSERFGGWVDVYFGNSEWGKCRPSDLLVLPAKLFEAGDVIPSESKALINENMERLKNRPDEISKDTKSHGQGSQLSFYKRHTANIDSLFYWYCECNAFNKACEDVCHSCFSGKSTTSKRSILLELAENAVNKENVASVEEAMIHISVANRPAIPEMIIACLLEDKIHGTTLADLYAQPSIDLDCYFYWICGSCKTQNSFKVHRCHACLEAKGFISKSSPVLMVAEKLSLQSKTIAEAYSLFPKWETLQIPQVVLESLITCAFITRKKGEKRCRNKKLNCSEYCQAHIGSSLHLSSSLENEERNIMDSESDSKDKVSSALSMTLLSSYGLAAINKTMQSFLKSTVDTVTVNELKWNVNNIEDSVLCGESKPFPLGLKVRRFFPGYGFHDGRIIKVRRQYVKERSKERPVLIYLVVYNDGDKEDFMHHEICSLSQAYDRYNVREIDPPNLQIPPGTEFEMISGVKLKVLTHKKTNLKAKSVGKSELEVATISLMECGDMSRVVDLPLIKFQLAVVRRIGLELEIKELGYEEHNNQCPIKSFERPQDGFNKEISAATLEWPCCGRFISNGSTRSSTDETVQQYNISRGLYLLRKCHNTESSAPNLHCLSNVDNPHHTRPGCKIGMWDPGNGFKHIWWDASQTLICNLCGIDKDDSQVVICENCHSGFHTYCLRPVMVNIPKHDWYCSSCTGRSNSVSFNEYYTKIFSQPQVVLKFLNLPYKKVASFIEENADALSLFSPTPFNAIRQQALSRQPKKVLFKVGSIWFVRSPDKNDWKLPTPLLTEEEYSISSFVAAMKYCGMTKYSENCSYLEVGSTTTEDMNDSTLEEDNIEPLSKRNLEIFCAFKENLKFGVFPPLRVIYDEKVGFSVEALKPIPIQTLISEYTGDVTTVEKSSEANSNSLMILLNTGDAKTSLIIDPTQSGNIARFLSGVNNRNLTSKRKANVRTRRFSMNGRLRIALFTSRRVEAGEKLNYDYNAGREGQSSEQWLKGGFYDTSNFF